MRHAAHASPIVLLSALSVLVAVPSSAQDESVVESESARTRRVDVEPALVVVGGTHFQGIVNWLADDEREDRLTTVALSRVGLRVGVGEHLLFESELELNAGPHGTSVWEGQAAISVRNQLLRLLYGGLRVDVGRITDELSLDYFSVHTANMLLTDPLTRYPLLVSGFNRGNGVLARYEIVGGLAVGLTVNAGNPTSTTGTVMIGGTFPPFARFYQVPEAQVGRDAHQFPTDSFQAVLLSPSLSYESAFLRAQAMFQYFTVNTNTNSTGDDAIGGYNLRGGVQALLLDGKLRPFVNASRVLNDVVEESDLATASEENYEARTLGGGIDFDFAAPTGVGVQYSYVGERQGWGTVHERHFVHLGSSWWFLPWAALQGRYSFFLHCEDGQCTDEEHSVYLTMRADLGAAGDLGFRP